MEKNLYEILRIDKNATIEEIKKSYKKLALEFHPDKNPDQIEYAKQQFQQISEAYSSKIQIIQCQLLKVLTNPEKRQKYELYGKVDEDDFNFEQFMNLNNFDEFFNLAFEIGQMEEMLDAFIFDPFNKKQKNKRKKQKKKQQKQKDDMFYKIEDEMISDFFNFSFSKDKSKKNKKGQENTQAKINMQKNKSNLNLIQYNDDQDSQWEDIENISSTDSEMEEFLIEAMPLLIQEFTKKDKKSNSFICIFDELKFKKKNLINHFKNAHKNDIISFMNEII